MFTEQLKDLISPIFDDNVLKDIVQKSSGCKQIIINGVNIPDGNLMKGYSYLSSIIKFTVDGTARQNHEKEEKISSAVIVKTLPKNIGRRKSFRSTDFFKNETIFYNEVWSTLMKFQESKSFKNKFDNIPLCLYAVADGVNDFIALEDLSAQSYIHFKRQEEMDYDSVIFIIRLFARFHALSFAFKDQFPKEFDKLADTIQETYFAENFRKWYTNFHKSLIVVSRDAIEKELPSTYLEKFDEMINNDFFAKLVKICGNKSNKLSVFTQGDAWIPNFLFKYDDNNKLVDIKMIDFQLARCCTPTTDVSFFLYSCASYSLLNTRWDDIIEEYHKTFTTFLSDMGSDPSIFTLEDLKADINENGVFGVGMSMEALPFQMMDESETPDLDTIEGDNAIPIETVFKVHPIKDAAGRLKIANMFKHAVDKGFV